MLEDWTTALARELGVELTVEVEALLVVARDAAHNVARPAAPITTFLVGYAAASQAGEGSVADLCRRASELALSWEPPADGPAGAPEPGSER